MKDNIFSKDHNEKFEFNEIVASVFDDMIGRSIPFYDEILNLCVYFIMQHLQDFENQKFHNTKNLLGQNQQNQNLDSKKALPQSQTAQSLATKSDITQPITIYDLGCSTGNLLLRLDNALYDGIFKDKNIDARLVGIDSSDAMIDRARLKARAMNARVEFVCEDFLDGGVLGGGVLDSLDSKLDPRVISALYTMQFIRPPRRGQMVKKIYDILQDGGIFLCAEKVISVDSRLESQMIKRYYDYKKAQGYSQGEIYKKREALENVLVPYSVDENVEMLKASGFSHIEILFKWVNFVLFYARK